MSHGRHSPFSSRRQSTQTKRSLALRLNGSTKLPRRFRGCESLLHGIRPKRAAPSHLRREHLGPLGHSISTAKSHGSSSSHLRSTMLTARFAAASPANGPRPQLEFLVQQGYTNLAVKPLKKLRKVRLSELRDSSRRIHAKLLAWRSGNGGGCLVGSANFTSAALDGRNVEACLLISDADELVEALFDRSLSKRPLALDDFVPGRR